MSSNSGQRYYRGCYGAREAGEGNVCCRVWERRGADSGAGVWRNYCGEGGVEMGFWDADLLCMFNAILNFLRHY